MHWMLPWVLLAVSPAESDAAFRDRARFDPVTQQGLVYLSLSDVDVKDQADLAKVVAYVVPSLSSKPNLQQQLPQRVAGTSLLRLDLEELGWTNHYQASVIQHYPYRPDITNPVPVYGHAAPVQSFPLVVSALWFIAQATDPNETGDMYYQLLYSGKPPKTLKEFRTFWKVQEKSGDFLGFVEGQSGVNVAKHRLIENHPTGIRSSSWSTFDSAKLDTKKDPLENLIPGSLDFDVGEHFVGIPKRSSDASGTLLAPFLTNKKGERQEVAPTSIVTDHLGTRTSEIRQFVSCVGCHATGMNLPTLNEYSQYITAGAKIYTKDKPTKEAIEAYLQSDFAKELTRANEDYATAVKMCNGDRPVRNASNYVRFVQRYDADVDMEQAARELGVSEKTLSLAIAYVSSGKIPIPARLAALAHGKPMPRKRWETESYSTWQMVQNFLKEGR